MDIKICIKIEVEYKDKITNLNQIIKQKDGIINLLDGELKKVFNFLVMNSEMYEVKGKKIGVIVLEFCIFFIC